MPRERERTADDTALFPLLTRMNSLAQVPTLLVALDFDGTLAPEVDDPRAARALPEARAAVLQLSRTPRTRVALISGRAIDSLEAASDLPRRILLAGSHGVEIRLDDVDSALELDTLEQKRVHELGQTLHRVAHRFDDVWLEEKPAGFALHTRTAAEGESASAQRSAFDAVQRLSHEPRVREGKNVLEFSVRQATKGDALERLRLYAGADAVLYAGDDVTDEDAFAVLKSGDLGIRIGAGATIAEFQVSDEPEFARLLSVLAHTRAQYS